MSVTEHEAGHAPIHKGLLKVIVQDILREYHADPSVCITDLETESISGGRFSGHLVLRVRVTWSDAYASGGPGSGTWVLKQWLSGGHGKRLLSIDRPLEAIAWEDGLLRQEALPGGVSVPIIGARVAPDERAAWILMEDVTTDLKQYSREWPVLPSEAVIRARQVLDRLARLHVRWEHPMRQDRLRACTWLVPMERFLWCEAASCAAVLGRTVPPGVATGRAVTDEYRADVAALLGWLPVGDRAIFEELMYRREPLVAALRAAPRTLVHGDLDDRNLGLRQEGTPLSHGPVSHGQAGSGSSGLVLIDWEWIGFGTPALDVAKVWATFAAVCDQSQPTPETVFSDELLMFYFDRYQAYGGVRTDTRSWLRECKLALIAQAMTQVSFIGSVLRHNIQPIRSNMERQFGTIMEAARSLDAA